MKTLILKNYKVENDKNYNYWSSNELECLARFINKNKIDGWCDLKPDAIIEYKIFENGNTHVVIDDETIFF